MENDNLEVTQMTIKGDHPIRKCPFLEPLRKSTGNIIQVEYRDCMRDECQIWDGENCSLHKERR